MKTYTEYKQQKSQAKQATINSLPLSVRQKVRALQQHYDGRNSLPLPFEWHVETWLTLDQNCIKFAAIPETEQQATEQAYRADNSYEEPYESNLSTDRHIVGINQFFSAYDSTCQNSENPNEGHILIMANAGMGKTTAMQRMVRDFWSGEKIPNNKLWFRFEFAFYIKLAWINAENDPVSVSDLVLKTLQEVNKDNVRGWNAADIYSILRNYPDRVIIFADGYDEMGAAKTSAIMRELKNYPNVVLTTRAEIPENADIMRSFPHRIELLGMAREEDIYEYIFRYFNFAGDTLGAPAPERKKAIEMIRAIRENREMMSLCTTPVCLYFLCFTIREMGIGEVQRLLAPGQVSLTSIYSKLIVSLAQRRENHLMGRREDFDPSNNDIVDPRDEESEVLIKISSQTRFMGLLAFEAMKANSSRVISSQLYHATLDKLVAPGTYSRFQRKLARLGLLRMVLEGTTNLNNADCYFVHRSIEEYFVAHHIASVLASEDERAIQEMVHFIRENCDKPKYNAVMRFLAGLTAQGSSQEAIKYFWDAITVSSEVETSNVSITRRIRNWRIYVAEAIANFKGGKEELYSLHPCFSKLQEIITEAEQLGFLQEQERIFERASASIGGLIDTITTNQDKNRVDEAYQTFVRTLAPENIDIDHHLHHIDNPNDKQVTEARNLLNQAEDSYWESGFLGGGAAIAFFIGVVIAGPFMILLWLLSGIFALFSSAKLTEGNNLKNDAEKRKKVTPEQIIAACKNLEKAEKGEKEVINTLLKHINHENGEVREAVCRALGIVSYKGDLRVIKPLLEKAKGQTQRVKIAAIEALGKVSNIGNATIVNALTQELDKSGSTELKLATLKAIIHLAVKGDEAVVHYLIKIIDTNVGDINTCILATEAARGLGKLAMKGDEASIEVLKAKYNYYDGLISENEASLAYKLSTTQALAQIATPEKDRVIAILFESLFELKNKERQVSGDTLDLYNANERALLHALANIPAYGVILTTLYQEVIAGKADARERLTFVLQEIIKHGWQFVLGKNGIDLRGAPYSFQGVKGIYEEILGALQLVAQNHAQLQGLITSKAHGHSYFEPITRVFHDDFVPPAPKTEAQKLDEINNNLKDGFEQNKGEHAFTRQVVATGQADTRQLMEDHEEKAEIRHQEVVSHIDREFQRACQHAAAAISPLADRVQQLQQEYVGLEQRDREQDEQVASRVAELTNDLQQAQEAFIAQLNQSINAVNTELRSLRTANSEGLSPERKAYYNYFCRTFTAYYITALVTNTGLVQTNYTRRAEAVSAILSSCAGLVPLGAAVVQLFTAIAKKVSARMQENTNSTYAAMASDPIEASRLARAAARRLAELYDPNDRSTEVRGYKEKLSELMDWLFETTSDLIEGESKAASTGEIVGTAITAADVAAEHKDGNDQESPYKKAGEYSAKLVLLGVGQGKLVAPPSQLQGGDLDNFMVNSLVVLNLPIMEIAKEFFAGILSAYLQNHQQGQRAVEPPQPKGSREYKQFTTYLADGLVSEPKATIEIYKDSNLRQSWIQLTAAEFQNNNSFRIERNGTTIRKKHKKHIVVIDSSVTREAVISYVAQAAEETLASARISRY